MDATLKIAVSGAGGTIGSSLCPALRAEGFSVIEISRMRGSGGVFWDPQSGEIEAEKLEGVEAVIHLAGESIAGRWTPEKKREILQSRTIPTSLLARASAGLRQKPRAFICASATGYYGPRPCGQCGEDAPKGGGFLAEVCGKWESACLPAREAGIRTVFMRQGAVISRNGGMLKAMLPFFRLGLGATIGDGSQMTPWIHIGDLCAAYIFAIREPRLEGPANAASPSGASNAEISRAVAKSLGVPMLFSIPKFAAELAFGGAASELMLASQDAPPKKLEGLGFSFSAKEIGKAVETELKIRRP